MAVFVKKGHDGEEPFEFKTDEEQVIEGLDTTVVSMKKGEVALARIPPEHAFGSAETKQDLAVVPPNSTVFYEVELVSFEKVCLKFLDLFSFSISCSFFLFLESVAKTCWDCIPFKFGQNQRETI